MKKINKKSIAFGLKILSILAFALMLVPATAAAYSYDQNYTYSNVYNGYDNYVYKTYSESNSVPMNNPTPSSNPIPIINSITPSSGDRSIGTRTITIIGSGFTPISIAKVNGANRYTTFIDYSHLLVQLNANDSYRTDGGFFITVFNGAPDGGFSNSAFFTVKNVTTSNPNVNNSGSSNNNYNSSTTATSNISPRDTATQTENKTDNTDNENAATSNLASNVIFGTNSFLPSGLVQWVLFAIVILLIVILARRLFGTREDYLVTPLKHD